jgi:uncharacterized protein (DUF952 family)
MLDDVQEPIFHITEPDIWRAQSGTGRYTQSTRGASLDDVGFIHCSFRRQVPAVAARVYPDRSEPLLLLEIDPDEVGAPVVVEALAGAPEEFPHIYGPLRVAAVRAHHDLVRDGDSWRVAGG